MNGPQTWTAVWEWTVGAGGGMGGGGHRGESWDKCNRITVLKKEDYLKNQNKCL